MHPDQYQPQDSKNRKAVAAFVLVLAIVIIAVGITVLGKKDKTAETIDTAQTSGQSPASPDTDGSQSGGTSTGGTAAAYKDGTYTATGSYMTPGGQEQIGVTLTLKDTVVTDSSLQQMPNNDETEEYQSKFASGYKQQVVGKKITDIKLSRVSGSSLTSQGFSDALKAIEKQAQS